MDIEETQQPIKEKIQETLVIQKKNDKVSKKKEPSEPIMNQTIIENLKILEEYEYINKEPYKAAAYAKVIDNIQLSDIQIKTKSDLKNIKGIGKSIEEKINELLTTGKIYAVNRALSDERYILGKQILEIYGIGPVKVYDILSKIKSFDDLYLPENEGLLNDKQKIGLKYYSDLKEHIPYEEAKKHNAFIQKFLKKYDQDLEYEMVGSYRRKAKSIGDIDILIKNKDDLSLKKIIAKLQEKGYILENLAIGKNKFMGICKLSSDLPARRLDILIAEPTSYYFTLLYFTGSFNFNIQMRKIALKKGLSLSEYGLKNNETKEFIDTKELINSEEDIFNYLEMPYVNPNKR